MLTPQQRERIIPKPRCRLCGKPYKRIRISKRYCSDACRQMAYRNRKNGIQV